MRRSTASQPRTTPALVISKTRVTHTKHKSGMIIMEDRSPRGLHVVK
jgi:hypothetical protein